MLKSLTRPPAVPSVHPTLARSLRSALVLGVLLVLLLLPAARGDSQWLGWWPLWLVAMPATALCALHRFRLPACRAARAGTATPRRRRIGPQARRRVLPAAQRLPRAA